MHKGVSVDVAFQWLLHHCSCIANFSMLRWVRRSGMNDHPLLWSLMSNRKEGSFGLIYID